MLLHRIVIVTLLLACTGSSCLAEQQCLSEECENTAQEIYYETLSPFCPGRSLADCPTEQARDVKSKILEDLKSGKSKQQVIEKFLQDYGQHLNSLPGFSGINILAWVLPVFIIIIGLIIVTRRTSLGENAKPEEDA